MNKTKDTVTDSINILVETIKRDKRSVKKKDSTGVEVFIPHAEMIDKIIDLLKQNPTIFDTPHPKVVSFFKDNFDEEIPWGSNSWNYYGVNFVAYFAPLAFSREAWTKICDEFFVPVKGKKRSGDTIQYINKSGQKGLEHQKVTIGKAPYYHLAAPLEKSIYRRKAYDKVTEDFYEVGIDRGIDFLEKWLRIYKRAKKSGEVDVGHRNPYGSDPSSENLIAQPRAINRAYKDKYIFDENGMIAAPSPSHLVDNIEKYYSSEAMNSILYNLLLEGKLVLDEKTVQLILAKHADTPV